MNVISYSRPKPETIQGPQAVKSIKQWLKNGLRLRGGTTALGFYFYELMTERLSLGYCLRTRRTTGVPCYYAC